MRSSEDSRCTSFGAAAGVGDALAVLRELLRWELAPARWEEVGNTVEILAAAAEAGDVAAVEQATVNLEMSGPVRITRIGSTPRVPPPPRVRERVNHLIHALTAPADVPPPGDLRDENRDESADAD
jgi:hypothetical protein